jgi:uncharacterized membrane protein YjgN (DUF898 family)
MRFGDQAFRFDIEAARKEGVYGAFAIGAGATIVAYVVFIVLMVGVMAAVGMSTGGASPDPLQMAAMMILPIMFALILTPVLILAYAPYHAAALRSVTAGIVFEGVKFRMDVRWPAMAGLIFTNLLLLLVSIGFLMPFVEARTWKFLLDRLRPEGEFDFAKVRQADGLRPSTGEGIADAFGLSIV